MAPSTMNDLILARGSASCNAGCRLDVARAVRASVSAR
jgi:hypothetical protein